MNKIPSSARNISRVHKLYALFILTAIFLPFLPTYRVSAAATITGRVFQDFNSNGNYDTSGTAPNLAIDAGVANVTVTAYDSSGVIRGTSTTIADGTYSLGASGTGPYRVEFTNLPAKYLPSTRSTDSVLGGTATNSGSTVQFVNDGGTTANVNLAINAPEDYCQNNPLLCSAIERPGNQSLTRSTTFTIPYNSPTVNTVVANESQTGSVWGTAYHGSSGTIFQAAVMKRHAGLGSLGTGGIYKINRNTGVVASYINVQSIGVNTGTDPRVTAGYTLPNNGGTPHWDYAAYTEVGKRAIGDLDYDDQRNILWFVNLADRRLHGIRNVNPNVTPVNADLVRDSSNNLGFAVNTTPAITCTNGVLRPWGIEVYRGDVYVGAVCTGENTGATAANLTAYVLRLNPDNPAGGFSQVVSLPLNYARNQISFGGNAPWQAWVSTDSTRTLAGGDEPQPIVSDLEFDKDGSLIMGLRDRWGDQYAANQYRPDTTQTNTTLVTEIYGFGDTLRFCYNGSVFSNPGTAGCPNNARPTGETRSANQGPGNGEFYSGDWGPDSPNSFSDVTHGALAFLPGSNRVVTTVHDPASYFSGGFIWLSNTNGSRLSGYDVFIGSSLNTTNDFNKGNGLGDVELLCDSAPMEVGNRVWRDSNSNGIQDAGENFIANVDVELWADTNSDGSVDTRVGQAQTDTLSGEYYFGGAGNVNMSTYACPTPLQANLQVNASANDAYETSAGIILNGGTNRLTRNFGTLAGDNITGTRFTGVNIPQGATITNAYIQFTANDTVASNAGSPTVSIRGEAADNSVAFTTTDFNVSGRADTTALVNWAVPTWATANEATADQRTPNLASIVQEIVNRPSWASGNAMSFTLSGGGATTRRDWETFDGNAANAPRLVIDYIGSGTCTYSLNRNTAYQVRVPNSEFGSGQPLFNLFPTNDNADSSSNGDSRDSDGSAISGGHVVANFNSGNPGNNNHSFDFGFSPTSTYSLGNRVFFDTNNNGIFDPPEFGISGVSLSLFADSDCNNSPDNLSSPLQSLTSDVNGYYRFDSLSSGCYFVRVNPSNFSSSALLEQYQNTTFNNTSDVDSFGAVSNAENGVDPSSLVGTNPASKRLSGVLSNMITLSGTSEPLNEPDVPSSGTFAGQGSFDNQADMTVDFGFYELCLCGTLWNDTGATSGHTDNGILDGDESVIPGMRVQLFDSLGNEVLVGEDGILGTADDAPGGMLSGVSGNYNFRGLPEGQYRVVVQSAGALSSTFNDTDSNIDNNDNGSPGSGSFSGKTVSVIITMTPGGEPLVNNPDGTTANTTVDFGFIVGPSAVVLDAYKAETDGEQTLLSWSTSQELNNLGFNVYRIVEGKREQVNKSLIVGSALRDKGQLQANAESYSLMLKEAISGAVYQLEDIDLEGNVTIHGVVVPVMSDLSRAKLGKTQQLEELTQSTESGEQTERVEFEKEESPSRRKEKATMDKNRQAKQWEIAEKGGVKITVEEAGWYEISREELQSAGFEVENEREKWQLFNNGEEVAIELRNDGAMRFYGEGIDKLTTAGNIYYLVKGEENGRRMTHREEVPTVEGPRSESFRQTVERKEKRIYTSVILNGEKENWFGSVVNGLGVTNQEVELGKVAFNSNEEVIIEVRMQGLVNVGHRVLVKLNETAIGEMTYQGQNEGVKEFRVGVSQLQEGRNVIGLQALNGNTDVSLVERVKVNYPRKYEAIENRVRFGVREGETVEVKGWENPEIELIEISEGKAEVLRTIRGEEAEEGGYKFKLNGERRNVEMIAQREGEGRRAKKVERNESSSLNRETNNAGMLIVTNEEMKGEGERLAALRQREGIKSKVVMVGDIYDEFSYGRKEPEGIREFLKTAKEKWRGKPEYVVLMGDTSYDPKGYSGQVSREIIPSKTVDAVYMETVSDSWLADFNADDIEDMKIGRLPAGNAEEARSLIEKLERYANQAEGGEKNQLMVADRDFENYTQVLESQIPPTVAVEKINRVTMTDNEFRGRILSSLAGNWKVVVYKGHGSTGVWTNANSLRVTDTVTMSNERLSFYMLMTCMNGYIQNVYGDSLGEGLLRSVNGGGIGVWASSGATTPNGQFEISQAMNRMIYEETGRKPRSLGEMAKEAKAATQDRTVRKTWLLLGDPSVRLK